MVITVSEIPVYIAIFKITVVQECLVYARDYHYDKISQIRDLSSMVCHGMTTQVTFAAEIR